MKPAMTLSEAARVRAFEKQNYALRLPATYSGMTYYNAYDTLIQAGFERLLTFPHLDEIQESQRTIDFALSRGEEI